MFEHFFPQEVKCYSSGDYILNYTNYDSIPVLITVQQFKEIKLKLHNMSN